MREIFKNISRRSLRVWQRNFDVWRVTWKIGFIPPIAEPLLYLAAFGLGLGGFIREITVEGGSVSYLKFIAPGLIAVAVMNYSFFETTYASFVRLHFQKTYEAILNTPLLIEDIIFGEILWAATKALFASAIMLGVSSCFGLIVFPAGFLILPLSFLAGLAFAALGMCFTASTKNIELFNFPVFLFITPMFLFGGVFFPLASLPLWAQKIAGVLPLSFFVSATRTLAFGAPDAGIFFAAGALILVASGATILSMAVMKKRLFP